MSKAPDKIKTKAGDLGPEHFDGDPLDINPAERMSEADLAAFEEMMQATAPKPEKKSGEKDAPPET